MFNGDVVYICRLPCIDGFDTFFQFAYCCHRFKLVRNNRKRGHNLIDDLYVNGETYSGKENVLQGFTEHFRQLATNNQNNESEYHNVLTFTPLDPMS
jgi:hypothetical protein